MAEGVLLSEAAERILDALLDECPLDGRILYKRISPDIAPAMDAKELENAKYIAGLSFPRHDAIRCTVLQAGREYFQNRPQYMYQEARIMFVKLPQSAKDFLLGLPANPPNGSCSSISGEETILRFLEERGFVKIVSHDIVGNWNYKLTYAGEHYDELEREYDMTHQSTPSSVNVRIEGTGQVVMGNNNIQTQNIGVDASKLDELVVAIKSLLDSASLEDRESINDNVEVIQEELKKANPKKGFVRIAVDGLRSVLPKIQGAVELTAAITTIIQFVQPLLI